PRPELDRGEAQRGAVFQLPEEVLLARPPHLEVDGEFRVPRLARQLLFLRQKQRTRGQGAHRSQKLTACVHSVSLCVLPLAAWHSDAKPQAAKICYSFSLKFFVRKTCSLLSTLRMYSASTPLMPSSSLKPFSGPSTVTI